MSAEEWRPIPGFDGYLASNLGRIASTKRHRGSDYRVLAARPHHTNAYPYTQLIADDGRKVCRAVHVLVALAFLGPRPSGQECRHLDGDRSNPRLDNLAYGTHSENMQDQRLHGTYQGQETECAKGHLFDDANTYKHPTTGHRTCRTCNRVNVRAYKERKMLAAANVPYRVVEWDSARPVPVGVTER